MQAKLKDSSKEMFSYLGILTISSQYILSTLMFVLKYKDIFTKNTELHQIKTGKNWTARFRQHPKEFYAAGFQGFVK
jgi:hypothetical protein